MDENLEKFEQKLKANNSKNAEIYSDYSIYGKSKIKYLSINEVISNVTSQLKVLQSFESSKSCCETNNRKKLDRTEFMSLESLRSTKKVLENKAVPPNFETCVTDTQLVNMVNDVEAAVEENKGITQEFDSSFHCRNIVDSEKLSSFDQRNNDIHKGNLCGNNLSLENDDRYADIEVSPVITSKSLSEKYIEVNQVNGNELNISNFCHEDKINVVPESVCNRQERSELPTKSIVSTESDAPLVCHLESFEKFERIAMPILEEQLDLKIARKIINSQVIGKEQFIPDNFEKISAIENNSFHINKMKSRIKKSQESQKYKSADYYASQRNYDRDKILFSSDEEENSQNTKIYNLPLTCVLKTTHHGETAVLDKTTFVGFQTASNKSIQVSVESLDKAKSILSNDVINEIENLPTETTENCDATKTEINAQNKNSLEQEMSHNYPIAKFKTASNKVIQVTDESLDTYKRVFCDIELDIGQIPYKVMKKTAPNVSLLNHKHSTEAKIININNDRLNKSHVMMKTANRVNTIESNSFTKSDSSINKQQVVPPKAYLEKSKFELNHNRHKNVIYGEVATFTVGFKTVSNKNIEISKNALSKNKNEVTNETTNTKYQNKNVIEESGIAVHKSFTKNLQDEQHTDFKLFKTVEIPQDALAHTKLFFQNKYNEGKENIVSDINITEKDQKMPDIQKKYSKYIKPEINHAFDIDLVNKKSAASIRDVKAFEVPFIENKSIIKNNFSKNHAKHINECVEFENSQEHTIAVPFHDKINSCLTSQYENETSFFCGFKTANGSKIKISRKDLSKSREIFKDIDCDLIKSVKIHEEPLSPSTLNYENDDNKEHKISKQTLLINKDHHNEIANVKESTLLIKKSKDVPTKSSEKLFQCPPLGFKTASNEIVNVPDHTLEKTKDFFNDIINDEFITKKFNENVGEIHKVNDENKVNIYEKLLSNKDVTDTKISLIERNKKMSNDIILGFKTASNRVIAVSKQALVKSHILYNDVIKSEYENINKSGSEIFNNIMDNESNQNLCTVGSCVGFKTASDKNISITKQALAKSKAIFTDIITSDVINDTDNSKIYGNNKTIDNFPTLADNKVCINEKSFLIPRKLDITHVSSQLEFKTGNNKNVHLSEQALKEFKNRNEINPMPNYLDTQDIINTQILENFENTLCTEDFMKRSLPNPEKRSISPILPCSKAKRKKFETPFKTNQNLNQKKHSTEITNSMSIDKDKIEKIQNSYVFGDYYKKNTKITLKDLIHMEAENKNMSSVDPYVLEFNINNLLEFQFRDTRNSFSNTTMILEELKSFFLRSVNVKIVPDGWMDNHLKMIIWKLISYEIKFPNIMQNICNSKNVMEQLCYRYKRELYNVERPALRKILEKDDNSGRTIILAVMDILIDGMVNTNVPKDVNNIELVVTDGWYSVKATVDKMLVNLVKEYKIVIGSKIVTHGAELLNCDQGVSPWEDTSTVRLKLFGNSTRRARWDARLGYHTNAAILTNLSSVRPDGGKVSKLRLFVSRVYPLLYVEKFEDGSTITRSERQENIYQMKYESERQVMMEKLYEQVEKEFFDEYDSQVSQNNNEDYTAKRREKVLGELQERFRDCLKESGLSVGRNVVKLLKVRVAGIRAVENVTVEVTKGFLSIWKPSDALLDIIKEGAWIDAYNVVPTAIRNSEIHLSANRQSVFISSRYKENKNIEPYTKSLRRICYTPTDLVKNPAAATDYNEVDAVGMVFQIEPSMDDFDAANNLQFQNVYLADVEKNFICINFWGGIRKLGFRNSLNIGQVIACVNLQKRAGNTRKRIPQYRATEFTCFTKTPKMESAKRAVENMERKFLGVDKNVFCQMCTNLKVNFQLPKSRESTNITPYRFNANPDYNISKHKTFIESPIISENNDFNKVFNLDGLDFESSFSNKDSENISPQIQLKKKQANDRIAKLQMYGEPPPLNPIYIINKSKRAADPYKSPLIAKDNLIQENLLNTTPKITSEIVDGEVAKEQTIRGPLNAKNNNSSNKTRDELEYNVKQLSPILNRTYVKRGSINPVKLNFSNNSVKEDNNNADHFAESFNVSPPLSLDSADCI